MTEKEEHKQIKAFLREYFELNNCIEIEFEKRFESGIGSKQLRPDVSFRNPLGDLCWVEIGWINGGFDSLPDRLFKCKELGYKYWMWCPKQEQKIIRAGNRGMYDFALHFIRYYPILPIIKIPAMINDIIHEIHFLDIDAFIKYHNRFHKPKKF